MISGLEHQFVAKSLTFGHDSTFGVMMLAWYSSNHWAQQKKVKEEIHFEQDDFLKLIFQSDEGAKRKAFYSPH